MVTTVVNYQDVKKHWDGFKQEWDNKQYVYIGRAHGRSKQPESRFHNPFKIGKDGSREEVIAKYRNYVINRPDLLRELWALKDKTLVCWCHPEACHGDVLAELLNFSGGLSKQKPNAGIEWTHVPGYAGYTANPVRGCAHGCRWRMPDGAIANCYAEDVANGIASSAYPKGFQHISFHPEVLFSIRRKTKKSAFFIDSMSDLMGRDVPDAWIQAVIDTMVDCPKHIFFLLTKNPPRLKQFRFPENCWVGVSAPPTFMFGRELTLEQQQRWYDRALRTLGEVEAGKTWTSIEPLSWDVSDLIATHKQNLDWAVIGAASNGRVTYQPEQDVLDRTLDALDGIPVFFKGNLDDDLVDVWREEFPSETTLMIDGVEVGATVFDMTLLQPKLLPAPTKRYVSAERILPSTKFEWLRRDKLDLNTIEGSDVLWYLRTLPSESVHCVVTSPPYYNVRDYGIDGQVGMEDSLAVYLQRMVAIFREVRRVLRSDGTCWLNMGDSYASSWSCRRRSVVGAESPSKKERVNRLSSDLKEKDKMMIPHRLAIALQEDGWWVRQDAVWSKRNSMPESVKDRPANQHEYVFLLTKAKRYWYDYTAVTKPLAEKTYTTYGIAYKSTDKRDDSGLVRAENWHDSCDVRRPALGADGEPIGATLRTVWDDIKAENFSEAHFATFPPMLPERCIKLGCPPMVCSTCGTPYTVVTRKEDLEAEDSGLWNGKMQAETADESLVTLQANTKKFRELGRDHDDPFPKTFFEGYTPACDCEADARPGVVLDPFMGAGTTGMVANRLGRYYVGCELNPDYVVMAEKRIAEDQARMEQAQFEQRNADPMLPLIEIVEDQAIVQRSLFEDYPPS